MQKIAAFCGVALLCLILNNTYAQQVDALANNVAKFPSRLFGRIGSKAAGVNADLTANSGRALQKMAQKEAQLRKRLMAIDSVGAKQLFAGSAQQYVALENRMRTDTGHKGQGFSGAYLPYLDSLQGAVGFMKQAGVSGPQAQAASSELNAMQAKMGDADQVKSFLQKRKQLIGQYLVQHGLTTGPVSKLYAGMNQQIYYYSQQLRQYKEIWTNPNELTQKALTIVNRLPGFQTYMQYNSMLGGLFHLAGSYGAPQAISGLQTKAQVAQLIQGHVSGVAGASGAAGGGGGAGVSALQGNLQNAQSQLDNYKSKLSSLGAGNGDMDMPDFKPNDQHTKTFWKRLEYGVNFQTSRTDYYFPTVTDFGASLGYRLGHDNMVGIGASYKLGWGNGIQHIAFSSQGVGLRSFLQIKIKGTFSATGGFEYNYTTPFVSYQQLKQLEYWTKSGLIGVTKAVSMKNRVFKKTSLSLLWDFLSYQQVPKTQPFVFRIGYAF